MTQLDMFPAPVPAAPADNVPRGTFPLTFPAHPDCTLCKLYTTAEHAGVPTRCLSAADTRAPRALVTIGMNPGYNEDLENTCWIGWSGRLLAGLLTDFVEATPANGIDVYLSNTARCRTPGTAKVTISIRKACFAHLRADLAQITTAYGEGNVYLLLLGAEACWLADGLSIRKSVGTQGLPRHLHIWPEGPAFPCFFTYHPAATAPGRDPALLGAIEDHLRFLRDSLFGATPAPSLPPSAAILRAPRTLPPAPLYSLDIETYGILRNHTQTVFHPARMIAIDNIPLDKMVVCCALSWYDGAGQLHSAWYNLYNGRDIAALHGAIRFIARHRPTLIGQNITFDLSCLRFRFPLLRPILSRRNFTLDDTTITNHLDSDMRPERTLKAQSRLFRSVDYDALSVSAARPEDQARSPEDPNLLLYNVADTIACLRARARHLSNIQERFGPNHPALTPFGRQFRSDLVWLVLHMTESGCAFDRRQLEEVHTTQSTLCKELILSAYSHDLIVAGDGTEKSQRTLFTAAASACGALDDSRLELTTQRKEISTGKANTNLLLGLLPLSHPLRRPLEILRDYKTASKLVSSYTTKLLHQPSEGCHLVGGSTSRALWMAFPSWYPTPGHVQDTGEEGGTKQGRFAAKKPAQQTLPPLVKACRTSRYGDDGILADFDMSQMELRTAALLSGDPTMIATYTDPNRDIHIDTTLEVWPSAIPILNRANPLYHDWYTKRQLGKRGNFLVVYRGGPRALVETARRYAAIEVPLPLAEHIVYSIRRRFARLCQWQEELIDEAHTNGHLLLATGWMRTFGGATREDTADSYLNEIANFPVQTTAAQCVQSAQTVILERRQSDSLTFVIPQQDHDSITIDCHRSSWPATRAMVIAAMTLPPLWRYYCEKLHRTVPLAVDCTMAYKGNHCSTLT